MSSTDQPIVGWFNFCGCKGNSCCIIFSSGHSSWFFPCFIVNIHSLALQGWTNGLVMLDNGLFNDDFQIDQPAFMENSGTELSGSMGRCCTVSHEGTPLCTNPGRPIFSSVGRLLSMARESSMMPSNFAVSIVVGIFLGSF